MEISQLRTSVTDEAEYRDFCMRISIDPYLLTTFRSHPVYKRVCEHVDQKLGLEYLSILLATGISTEHLRNIALNDLVGSPDTFDVGNKVTISGTTLRHAKVASDFKKYFGSLQGANICEIGVGYGGLCRIVDLLYNIRSYSLVDIQSPLELAKRYLGCFPVRNQLKFLTMNEAGNENYDLVISNYAFSELTRTVQEVYLNKIIKKSASGYMIYNNICPSDFQSMTSKDLAGLVNGIIMPELPCSDPNNCTIIWKKGFSKM